MKNVRFGASWGEPPESPCWEGSGGPLGPPKVEQKSKKLLLHGSAKAIGQEKHHEQVAREAMSSPQSLPSARLLQCRAQLLALGGSG